MAPNVISLARDFRHHWSPQTPTHPVEYARLHPDHYEQLLPFVLVEAFWLSSKYGRGYVSANSLPTTVERFTVRFPEILFSDDLKLDLIAVEFLWAGVTPDAEALRDRFPSLEAGWQVFIADPSAIARRVKDARVSGSNAATQHYDGPSRTTVCEVGQSFGLEDAYVLETEICGPDTQQRSGEKWVWLARQRSTGRTVVVKLPQRADNASRSKLVNEAKLIARLEHQNIPPTFVVFDPGQAKGREPFLAERFIPGASWGQVLTDQVEKRNGLLEGERLAQEKTDLDQNLQILISACNALSFVHRKRHLIHRDVKPDNIMLAYEQGESFGEVFVTDWSLATQVGEKADSELGVPHWSKAFQLAGTATFEYAPPEIVRTMHGRAENDDNEAGSALPRLTTATDVFMLGALTYHFLSGIAPFSDAETSTMVPLRKPMPSLLMSRVPEALWGIIQRACAAAQKDRFTDAGEFRDAIISYQTIAQAETDAATSWSKFQVTKADMETQASTRSGRLTTVATLIERANELKQAAQKWDHLKTAQSPAPERQLILDREREVRLTLAKLAESTRDYGTAQSQYEQAALIPESDARTLRAKAASMKVKDIRTRVMVWSSGVFALLLILLSSGYLEADRRNAIRVAAVEEDKAKVERAKAKSEKEGREKERQIYAKQAESGGDSLSRLGRSQEATLAYAQSLDWEDSIPRKTKWQQSLYKSAALNGQTSRTFPGRGIWTSDSKRLITAEAMAAGNLQLWDAQSGELIASLPGHPEPKNSSGEFTCVRGLAMDRATSDILYSAGIDGVLRRTDLATKLSITSKPSKTPLTALTVAHPPTQKQALIVTGDDKGKLTFWSEDLKSVRSLTITDQRIMVLEATSDASHLAYFTPKGVVQLLKADGTFIAELPLEGNVPVISSIAFSPDGTHLAAGAKDGSVPVWRVADQKLVSRAIMHGPDQEGLAVTREVRWRSASEIVSAGADGVLAIHHPFNKTAPRKSEPVPGSVKGDRIIHHFALSPDGKRGYTGDFSRVTSLWDMDKLTITHRATGQLSGFETAISMAKLHQARGILAVSGMDPQAHLRLINASTMEVLTLITSGLPDHDDNAPFLSWSNDGRYLAVAFCSGLLSVYEVKDDPTDVQLVWQKPAAHGPPVQTPVMPIAITLMGWANDGNLITAGTDNRIRRWNGTTGDQLAERSCELPLMMKVQPGPLAEMIKRVFTGIVEPDGKHIVATQPSTQLYRFEVDSEAQPQVITTNHISPVNAIDIALDGQRLVTGDSDGLIATWNWASPKQFFGSVLALKQHSSPEQDDEPSLQGAPMQRAKSSAVTSVRFTRDGNFVAVARGDQTVMAMDALTLKVQHSAQLYSATNATVPVIFCDFTNEGELITSAVTGEVFKWSFNSLTVSAAHAPAKEEVPTIGRSIAYQPETQSWLMQRSDGRVGAMVPSLADGAPDLSKLSYGLSFQRLKNYTGRKDGQERGDNVLGIAPVPGKPWCVLLRGNGEAHVVDQKTKTVIAKFTPPSATKGFNPRIQTLAVTLSANGELAAVADAHEAKVHLFSPADGKLIRTLSLREPPPASRGATIAGLQQKPNLALAIVFHPTKPEIAIVQEDARLAVWDYQQGKLKFTTEAGPSLSKQEQLAYSPDGKDLLQAGTVNGSLVVWNADTGEQRQELKAHEAVAMRMEATVMSGTGVGVEEVTSVRFLPNAATSGTAFLSGGSDGNVILWRRTAEGDYEKNGQLPLQIGMKRYARAMPTPVELSPGQPDESEMLETLKNLPPDQRKLLENIMKETASVSAAADATLAAQDSNSVFNDALISQSIESMAISADGRWLVLSSFDGIHSFELAAAIKATEPPKENVERYTRDRLGLEPDDTGALRIRTRMRLQPVK